MFIFHVDFETNMKGFNICSTNVFNLYHKATLFLMHNKINAHTSLSFTRKVTDKR